MNRSKKGASLIMKYILVAVLITLLFFLVFWQIILPGIEKAIGG